VGGWGISENREDPPSTSDRILKKMVKKRETIHQMQQKRATRTRCWGWERKFKKRNEKKRLSNKKRPGHRLAISKGRSKWDERLTLWKAYADSGKDKGKW